MNRGEALTETAMNVSPEQWDGEPIMHYRQYEFGWNEYMQRRTELINEPDDAEAPEWARWKCQDSIGTWEWHSEKPIKIGGGWDIQPGEKWEKSTLGKIPAGHRWQDTLKEVNPVKRELNPNTSSLTDSQARIAAIKTGVCADGVPCLDPNADCCDDCPNAPHAQDARRLDEQLRDAINPGHYRQGGIECIDAIKAATVGKKGIEAACVANVIKYLWRYEEKNGVEDVRKAIWYIKLLESELNE